MEEEKLDPIQKTGIMIISVLTITGILFGISLNFILPDMLNDSVDTVQSFEEVFSDLDSE